MHHAGLGAASVNGKYKSLPAPPLQQSKQSFLTEGLFTGLKYKGQAEDVSISTGMHIKWPFNLCASHISAPLHELPFPLGGD